MSNFSTSSAHLAAIAHDPLEEGETAGLTENHAPQAWRGGASDHGMRSGGARHWSLRDTPMPNMPMPKDSLRPVLLAGALGLFAAWVVSGMGKKQTRRSESGPARQNWSAYVGDREASRFRPQRSPGVGSEGASSPQDERLDALNP